MGKEKVTISEIAKALNTSAVTVSRALADQPGVGDDLKQRIIKKAYELGYPKLKRNESVNILVLHQQPFSHDNSNFSAMVQGLEKALQLSNNHYDIEYIDKESQVQNALPFKLTGGKQYDGVIMLGRFEISYAHFITKYIENLIYFTGYSPAYNFDSVWFGFMNAGYIQTEYLFSKGHKNIGFIGNTTLFRNKEKLIGINSALNQFNYSLQPEHLINSNENYKALLTELQEKQKLPTAFICDYDYTAVDLIKFLYNNHIKVPEDISVIGSGNTEISTLSNPSLTTMDLNIPYACEVVVETLLKKIARPDRPTQNIAVLSKFIERDSVKALTQ